MAQNFDVVTPIAVSSDRDLADLVAVNGWNGTGTSSDPFVLDGIMVRNEDTCVRMANLRKDKGHLPKLSGT